MPGNLADFESTLRRLGGDQVLFFDLVRFYFEDSPRLMEQLRLAVLNCDANAIERLAHSLKGLVGNFDRPLPTETAMLIEQMGRAHDFQGVSQALPILEDSLRQLHDSLIPFRNSE
jgi:HPt (histidine-containing phosphotransfer) domain-containing protein